MKKPTFSFDRYRIDIFLRNTTLLLLFTNGINLCSCSGIWCRWFTLITCFCHQFDMVTRKPTVRLVLTSNLDGKQSVGYFFCGCNSQKLGQLSQIIWIIFNHNNSAMTQKEEGIKSRSTEVRWLYHCAVTP